MLSLWMAMLAAYLAIVLRWLAGCLNLICWLALLAILAGYSSYACWLQSPAKLIGYNAYAGYDGRLC
jgi:hypothetical protein